jgi:hypothetical protein
MYIQKSSSSLPSSSLPLGSERTQLDDIFGVCGSDYGEVVSSSSLKKRARCRAWPPTCPQRCRLGSSMIPLRRPPPPYIHAMSRRSHHRRHRHQRAVAFPRHRGLGLLQLVLDVVVVGCHSFDKRECWEGESDRWRNRRTKVQSWGRKWNRHLYIFIDGVGTGVCFSMVMEDKEALVPFFCTCV